MKKLRTVRRTAIAVNVAAVVALADLARRGDVRAAAVLGAATGVGVTRLGGRLSRRAVRKER